MIITDYNSMTIEELDTINRVLGREYVIEDGRITKVTEKIGREER